MAALTKRVQTMDDNHSSLAKEVHSHGKELHTLSTTVTNGFSDMMKEFRSFTGTMATRSTRALDDDEPNLKTSRRGDGQA